MTLMLAMIISWLQAYFRVRLWLWSLAAFVLLWCLAPPGGFAYAPLVWGPAIPLALILNLPTLRRPILASPLLRLFKKMLARPVGIREPGPGSRHARLCELAKRHGICFTPDPGWQELIRPQR